MQNPHAPIHNEWNETVRKMRSGNRKAAELLYKKLFHKVFGFAMHRVGNRATAEDITQDIFMKLIEKIDLFDSAKGGFLVWFWQLARNTVTDHLRKARTVSFSDIETGDEEKSFDYPDHAPALEDAAATNETLRSVYAALASATPEERELFELRFIADLPYSEIAAVTGRSEGTLRVSISRLKQKLKDATHHV
ncbi:MAG: RNA polymerase sigma factor [Patescibacteria group bacterium]